MTSGDIESQAANFTPPVPHDYNGGCGCVVCREVRGDHARTRTRVSQFRAACLAICGRPTEFSQEQYSAMEHAWEAAKAAWFRRGPMVPTSTTATGELGR